MTKNTPEFVQQKVLDIHKGIVTIDLSTYVGMREKALFIDSKYGKWWTKPINVLNSRSGHPLRKKDIIREKLTLSEKELKNRLSNLYDSLIEIDYSTYKSMNYPARFVDRDFGEWWTYPTNVFHNEHMHPKRGRLNFKNTCLELYGVENPSQIPGIQLEIKNKNVERYGVEHLSQSPEYSLRTAKKLKQTTIRFHWKTGEELICQASYEVKTVDHLNNNKIDFLWQSATFKMPTNQTYRPDFFLIRENKWIEIKGWMRPKAQLKWDWFKTQFPTAELWDKKKLKEMGIL